MHFHNVMSLCLLQSDAEGVFSSMTRFLPDCYKLQLQPGISCQTRITPAPMTEDQTERHSLLGVCYFNGVNGSL